MANALSELEVLSYQDFALWSQHVLSGDSKFIEAHTVAQERLQEYQNKSTDDEYGPERCLKISYTDLEIAKQSLVYQVFQKQ